MPYTIFNRFLTNILPIIIFVNISLEGFPQSHVILDSLNNLYKKTSRDTTKILLLADIANEYNNIFEPVTDNFGLALNYARKGYYWARKINYQKGINRNSLQMLVARWYLENDTLYIEQKLNNILTKSVQINDIRNELYCYNALIYILHDKNDSLKANSVFKKALELSLKKDESYAPEIINAFAFAEMDWGNQSIAEIFLNKAIKISLKKNNYTNKLILSINYIQYSSILKYKDNARALTYMLEANELDEDLKDMTLLNYNNYLIREIYDAIGDYENSLKYTIYYLKSIKDTTTTNYYGEIMSVGWLQYLKKDYYNALKNSEKAKIYYAKLVNAKWIDKYNYAICLSNLGLINLKLGKNEEALHYALESENKIKEINRITEDLRMNISIQNFLVIASVNSQFGKINLSNQYAYKTLEVSQKISDKTLLPDIYLLLYENHKRLNDFPNALLYYENAIHIKDSISEIEKTNHINSILSELEVRKKDAQIQLASKEKRIAQEKNRVQRLYTILFGGGFVLVLLLSLVSIRSYKQQKKSNKLLSIQKNHIAERNEELSQLNEEISAQRDMLFQQKKSITDSMEYARFIQQALLTSRDILNNCQLQNFILFKPRDIISGDFYWFKQIKNYLYFTAADCTGHGIPGAFMSVLGISLLNEIVGKRDLNPPAQILNELRKRLKKSLKQDDPETTSHDGMDIALCLLDLETYKLQFSGAFNPLFLIRNNVLIEYPANRIPVGVHPKDKIDFTNHEIQLQTNDLLYIFSDGYISQFGGEEGKKFNMKQFKELLIEINNLPLDQQKIILDEILIKWQQNFDQIDDVLVVGIKV